MALRLVRTPVRVLSDERGTPLAFVPPGETHALAVLSVADHWREYLGAGPRPVECEVWCVVTRRGVAELHRVFAADQDGPGQEDLDQGKEEGQSAEAGAGTGWGLYSWGGCD